MEENIQIVQVSAGLRHTVFLDIYGRVYSCGNHKYG
jgi:alpha-tubulin suppressor-like RCC1 family protein